MQLISQYTVVPVMNGHPRDQAIVSVHCRWLLIRGNLTLKCVGRGIDNVAVQGRWPLTTGVAQGRYYCSLIGALNGFITDILSGYRYAHQSVLTFADLIPFRGLSP